MRAATNWKDFEVLDTSGGEKLERWGDVTLVRPDPQVIWNTPRSDAWRRANARYDRSPSGGGSWRVKHLPKAEWEIGYGDLRFHIRPTGFKHTGLFPEQAVNWDYMASCIQARKEAAPREELRVLNLFAYTGGATMACARAGAAVAHVDSARGMVAWAKDNARLCGLKDAPIRYLVDDCLKFVRREQRRGRTYHGIVMDPPSYGRGPDGEMFRFETHVYPLIEECAKLLDGEPLFFLLNSYTSGFAPAVAQNALTAALPGGVVEADNIGLLSEAGLNLPCGATARWRP